MRKMFFLCSHIKIHMPFWDELKKNLTLKIKHNLKNKNVYDYF